MRTQSVLFGIIAAHFLPLVLAVSSPELVEVHPMEDSFFEGDPLEDAFEESGLLDGAELAPHGYLVPAHISPEDYDVNAPWMVPVEPVNQDTNETIIFDDEGYDMAARLASEGDDDAAGTARQLKFRFMLSRFTCDMGCGATVGGIRQSLGEAVYALCKGDFCGVHNQKYIREIIWMDNGGYRSKRYVEITASGSYSGPHTLGNMHNAVKASVQSGSVSFAWRRRYPGPSGVGQSCKMAKFPNIIAMDKNPPNKLNDVRFVITLRDVDAKCLGVDVMALVTGAINGAVGTFFGAVSLFCNA